MTTTDALAPDNDQPPPGTIAELTLAVQAIGGRMDRELAARRRAAETVPVRAVRQKGGTVPASGPLVLDLGAPAMGRRWSVRNLSVCNAAAVRTAATGTADVYVGNPGVYSPVSWRWGIDALPGAVGFSADRVEVIPTDHLFVVVEGGTAGDGLFARAEVLDYPADSGREVIPL